MPLVSALSFHLILAVCCCIFSVDLIIKWWRLTVLKWKMFFVLIHHLALLLTVMDCILSSAWVLGIFDIAQCSLWLLNCVSLCTCVCIDWTFRNDLLCVKICQSHSLPESLSILKSIVTLVDLSLDKMKVFGLRFAVLHFWEIPEDRDSNACCL